MKKILSIILALAMLGGGISVFATDTQDYTIYNETFEDMTLGSLSFKSNVSVADEGYNSSHSLEFKVDEENGYPCTSLTNLQRKSKSDISVWVKLNGSSDTLCLKATVTINKNKNQYILSKKTVDTSKWVQLSGRIDTRLMNPDSPIEISVESATGKASADILFDEFKVVSDRADAAAAQRPVSQLADDGKYKRRFSFETGMLDMLNLSNGCSYIATDETEPHSGKYCLKITDRINTWDFVCAYLRGADKKSRLRVSAYFKKSPNAASANCRILGNIVLADGTKAYSEVASANVTDNEWHLLEGVVDCSQYDLGETGYAGFNFLLSDKDLNDYYLDDILITSDSKGDTFDDYTYDTANRDPSLSETAISASAIQTPIQEDIPSLKDVYKDYFKIGGNSYMNAASPLDGSKMAMRGLDLYKKHFNSFVSNGYFKMQEILSEDKKTYDFTNVDFLMNFCKQNNMEVAGHVLIWETSGMAKYAKNADGTYMDRDTCLAFMKEYITKVMKHCEGDGDPSEYTGDYDYSDWHVAVWDVCNEAVEAGEDKYANRGAFVNCFGSDYIKYAFQYADETGYDDTELRYNDFGEHDQAKREAIYNLVKNLKNEGYRVDTVGVQSHYSVKETGAQIRKVFEKLTSLDVNLNLTEIDISAYTWEQVNKKVQLYEDGIPKTIENAQAMLLYDMFQLCKEYSDKVNRVTFWTYLDGQSYQNEYIFRKRDYAGIFDRNFQAKPQYWAIADPKYFFEECLKEDTSKLRIVMDGIQIESESDVAFVQNDVSYYEASKLFELMKKKYAYNEGKYSVISNGIYTEFKEGSEQILNFKPYTMNAPVISRDGKLYVPVMETCNMLGFVADYVEARNMINISSQGYGSNL